ncbi:hypothetical protein MKEN_01231000 [Mycena kentingensis (nom. inval.)]|nr:hypothetical protein MKEN_01231000 [Mycena kentingensis (nom. inval.)]
MASLKSILAIAGLLVCAQALDFSASSWIWTNEVSAGGASAPVGARAFRKTFTPPRNKTPVLANIIIDADNSLTLFVNGGQIGTGDDFRFAELFCVALRPCQNVFAVTATNGGGPAGLIATIQVVYSDGTTSTLVTDTTWRYALGVPANYQQLTIDDNAWPAAIAQGKVPMAPWGQPTIPTTPPTLTLTKSSWIWTNEVSGGNAPPGSRAFRRTYVPPTGTTPSSARIAIAADNAYSLWVNGVFVGSGSSFSVADTYTVPLSSAVGASVVFAVQATNTLTVVNPAGLIAAIEIFSAECNCTSGAFITTDGSWKYSVGVPSGFQDPGFNDASWPAAIIEAPYGAAPWGNTVFTP